jgi:hypothetical protein
VCFLPASARPGDAGTVRANNTGEPVIPDKEVVRVSRVDVMNTGDHDLLRLLSALPTLTTAEAERFLSARCSSNRSPAHPSIPTSPSTPAHDHHPDHQPSAPRLQEMEF